MNAGLQIDVYLAKVLDLIGEPVIILDNSKSYSFANSHFMQLVGTSKRKGKVAEFWIDAPASFESGEITVNFFTSEKKPLTARLSVTVGDLIVARVLASSSSGTDIKAFHAQRLETLGVIAGGVAHDFNNVLTGMLGHLAYLRTILASSGDHLESLSAIEEGAVRASTLTNQIVKFSKVESEDVATRVNLPDLIRRTCVLLRGAISPQVSLDAQIDFNNCFVLGSEGKLAQIILNLAVNARDAVENVDRPGKIVISLQQCKDQELLEHAFAGHERASNEYVILSVSDNGQGIGKENLERIFEPYFSTKRERGTGLGLAMVRAIVDELGGAIQLRSSMDSGTTFSIYLPCTEAPDVEQKTGKGSTPELEAGHGERILVIDDEASVRNVLTLSLQHLGYNVAAAKSGREGLDIFTEKPDSIDLVILDMLMPGLSGEETFKQLVKIKSNVKVLVVSGFSGEQSITNVKKGGARDYIQKPFTIEILSQKVRQCLND